MSDLRWSQLFANAKGHQFDAYDRLDPAVECGSYALEVEQTLLDEPAEMLLHSKGVFTLQVEGPRLLLLPEHVLGCFPPPGARDVPWNRIPHVALTRRTLPWERNLPSFKDFDPWMALIVLQKGEYVGEGVVGTSIGALPTSLKELYTDANVAEETRVQTIRVHQDVLKQILIPVDDLQLACHARQLPVGDQDARGDEDGFISIVLANRVCAPGQRHLACLVSLEGQQEALAHHSFETFTSSQLGVIGWKAYHTFVVLHTWEFTTGTNGDFEALIKNISVGRLGGECDGAELPLRYLNAGARERLVAYHGPAVPEPPPSPSTIDDHPTLAWSAAALVAPALQSGEESAVSSGAAFELGRLLTLANQPALSALQRFRTTPWDLHLDQALAKGLLSDQTLDPSAPALEAMREKLQGAQLLPLPELNLLKKQPSVDPSGSARLDPNALTGLAAVRNATEVTRTTALSRKAQRVRRLSATANAEAAEAPFSSLLAAALNRDDP